MNCVCWKNCPFDVQYSWPQRAEKSVDPPNLKQSMCEAKAWWMGLDNQWSMEFTQWKGILLSFTLPPMCLLWHLASHPLTKGWSGSSSGPWLLWRGKGGRCRGLQAEGQLNGLINPKGNLFNHSRSQWCMMGHRVKRPGSSKDLCCPWSFSPPRRCRVIT